MRSPSMMMLALALAAPLSHAAERHVPLAAPDVITVGIRGDAQPFSYRSAARAEEPILEGFGGYIVEVCRRVLSEMVVSGPFAGFDVRTREVRVGERFDDLDAGRVDMLCGPDSITLSRLFAYNASHPLFLSGITYVSAGDEQFPRSVYCGAVLGLVAGTTAETEGLQKIAERGDLQIFDGALDRFLAIWSERENGLGAETPLDSIERLAEAVAEGFAAPASEGAHGLPKVAPSAIRTQYCPDGFTQGPVVFYDSHQQGLEDLCQGLILYYVADFDIISERLAAMPDCDFIPQRETLTREVYGIFFRRDTGLARRGGGPTVQPGDSALYAEFNNVLLRKMQRTENILDYEFAAEFDEVQPTDDLKRFFDGYKFASDY